MESGCRCRRRRRRGVALFGGLLDRMQVGRGGRRRR